MPGLVDRLREPSSNASSAHLAGSEPSLQVSTSPLSEQAGLEPSLHRQSPPSLNRGFSAVRAARHGAVRACGLTAVSTAQPVPAPEVKMEEQCIMSSKDHCNANNFVGPTRPHEIEYRHAPRGLHLHLPSDQRRRPEGETGRRGSGSLLAWRGGG